MGTFTKIKNNQGLNFVKNLAKAFGNGVGKHYDVYQDNALNRKLGRVGQPYPKGKGKEGKGGNGSDDGDNKKKFNIQKGIKFSNEEKKILKNLKKQLKDNDIPLDLINITRKKSGSLNCSINEDKQINYYGEVHRGDPNADEVLNRQEYLDRSIQGFTDQLEKFNYKLNQNNDSYLSSLNSNYKDFLSKDGTITITEKNKFGKPQSYTLNKDASKEILEEALEKKKIIRRGGIEIPISNELLNSFKGGNWDFTINNNNNNNGVNNGNNPFKS